MRCLYTSDLHGNRWLYERLFDIAEREAVDAVILGGDLSPLEPPLDHMIEVQRNFWQHDLPRWSESGRRRGARLVLIPGNDDLRANDDAIGDGAERGDWELVDGTTTQIGEVTLAGLATVPLTPFLLKDREAYDVDPGVKQEDAVDLFDSSAIYSTAKRSEPPTLVAQLYELVCRIPVGRPFALMTHSPPYDTRADVLFDGRHVGSRAVRQVIEERSPLLSLHGHIHESPDMAEGSWRDAIGSTSVVNAGSRYFEGEAAPLRLVSFDTGNIETSLRHDVR